MSSTPSPSRPSQSSDPKLDPTTKLTATSFRDKTKSTSFNLAKSAANEADKALALEPRDPASQFSRPWRKA
ncbi:hypothetical protein ACS0TY_021921 [Phlomoides rotata]